ncbi:hexose kinase [Klugiella xanthotipulae]|uniref:1-phosphofructokinase n=1 Tax=Klugiella xanthotipulae TaxID=244735 RepID=A0A543I675_9MICO|nr:1-phosphofructokinase family hexose kinase [Klugiella xanthotipulae]TQM66074.1 1-phosphofructokinase [Klugiella xanthotipulae]
MIVTLTPNPSLDRTIELTGPLERGAVQRSRSSREEPGGKGVNISRALGASGVLSLAILPGDGDDPVLRALRAQNIPHLSLPLGARLRSNVAVTEPDGTTTKLNEPGPELSTEQQQNLIDLVLGHATGAAWLVLAGSLPPGVPADFYATLTAALRGRLGNRSPLVAVDSSGAPLAAAIVASPDLIKPNAEELAELTGYPDPAGLEGDPARVADLARTLVARGVGAVLATLGSKGAVLTTAEGSWLAQTPPIRARSTVGAGDSSLAGYLLTHAEGGGPEARLRQAVAHGAAAAGLPGSTVPARSQTSLEAVTVTPLAAPRIHPAAPASPSQ